MQQGHDVFARTARCHSSQNGPYENVDFNAVDPSDPSLRLDWLGNDEPVFASQIGGTYPARAAVQSHAKPGLGQLRLAQPP